VHGWLVRSAIAVANGDSTIAAERTDLATAQGAFRRVNIDLRVVFAQVLKDAGAGPTLEEWRARFGDVPPPF
jgi:hypothetical protein